MARSNPEEQDARQAIRMRLAAGDIRNWGLLRREFAQVPERTFYNWVKQERTRTAQTPPMSQTPKTMPTVRRLLSSAFNKLDHLDCYEQSWDDYHLHRQSCFVRPGVLNAPRLRENIALNLKLAELGADVRNELLLHNGYGSLLESLVVVIDALEKSRGEPLAMRFGASADRLKRKLPPEEPQARTEEAKLDIRLRSLAGAFSEVQVRELYNQLWTDCEALRERAVQIQGDAGAVILRMSIACKLKVMNAISAQKKHLDEQELIASWCDQIVGMVADDAPELLYLFDADRTVRRDAYGAEAYPFAQAA